jgi:hypothetical protein
MSKKEEEKNYAIELLDNTMDSAHRKTLSPLLMDIFLTEHVLPQSLESESFYQVLKNNLAYSSSSESKTIIQLTYMASAYVIIKKPFNECFKELEDFSRSNNDPLIQETINWLKRA